MTSTDCNSRLHEKYQSLYNSYMVSSYAVYVHFGMLDLIRTAIQQVGIAASVYHEDCGNILHVGVALTEMMLPLAFS